MVASQADKTFLPLALRLLITLRPPTVAIRALKPCVALFFFLLGWYVLFIHATSKLLYIEHMLINNTF